MTATGGSAALAESDVGEPEDLRHGASFHVASRQ